MIQVSRRKAIEWATRCPARDEVSKSHGQEFSASLPTAGSGGQFPAMQAQPAALSLSPRDGLALRGEGDVSVAREGYQIPSYDRCG